MNENNDIHSVFVVISFCLLFAAVVWELVMSLYSSFLALSGCGGAAFAAYVSTAAPAQSTKGYDDAAASAISFYREHTAIQDKDIAYLRQQTTSLEAERESKAQEVVILNEKISTLETELETKTQEAVTLSQLVSGLEATLAEARAREAEDPPQKNLPTADKIYRKLALKYHPDHNHDTPKVDRAEVMTDINMFWQRVKADAR